MCVCLNVRVYFLFFLPEQWFTLQTMHVRGGALFLEMESKIPILPRAVPGGEIPL